MAADAKRDEEQDTDKHTAEGAGGTATEDGAGDEHADVACGQQEREQDVCTARCQRRTSSSSTNSSSSTMPLPPGSPPPAMLMSMTSTGMSTHGHEQQKL